MSLSGASPIRTCLGCGARRPQRELVRLVVGAQGQLDVDPGQGRGGRGAYLCLRAECLANARHQNRFGRALRRPGLGVAPDEALGELVARRLEERLLERLQAARRCGGLAADGATPEGSLLIVAAGTTQPESSGRVLEIEAGSLGKALGAGEATRVAVTSTDFALELEGLARASAEFRRVPERPRRRRRERPQRGHVENSR